MRNSMDIYTAPGEKIVFTGEGGYPYEGINAKKILDIGKVYTINNIEIHSSCSYVKLNEITGEVFNTTMFENKKTMGYLTEILYHYKLSNFRSNYTSNDNDKAKSILKEMIKEQNE